MLFEEWDQELFQYINREWTHPALDFFFIYWTDIQKTPVFYFLILPLLLFYVYRKRAWTGVLYLALGFIAMGVADFANAQLIKPFFERARPFDSSISHLVVLRIPESGGYSFPSSHAVDAFCLAQFLKRFFPALYPLLFIFAFLIAYSRVYCGVHFPADVIAGALIGSALGWIFARLKKGVILISVFLLSFQAHGFEDPTGGKPFVPWLWQDQLKPTLKSAVEESNLYVLAGGAALTGVSFEYDDSAHEVATELITKEQAQIGSIIGGGPPLIGLALIQLVVDQEAGLAHGRAILFTAASHISIAALTQRERPNGSPTRLSFPSGHASHVFASATSLAYSYGPWVGTLAYGVAVWNGLSRIREEAHWLSDVVAGATLGIFWGRASAKASEEKEVSLLSFYPMSLPGGAGFGFHMKF